MSTLDSAKIIQANHPPAAHSPKRHVSLEDLQPKLTDFILHLIQAFLRTGYYTAEHPESKRAKEGLYQQFQSFFEQEGELTFLVREDQERKEVLLEGLFPEAQRLNRMMAKGMGELYVPRMVKYLERKDLVSLTLKSRMDATEFIHFVDIMSEPSLVDIHRKEDQENFAQTLYRHGVYNISYIFNEEMLAPAREVPWRVRLMLSRLRKDLKMIPLFQELSGGELQEIRKKLIQDGIRAIRHPDLLCAVLRNSDLAATPENPEEVIENGILSSIHTAYFLDTAKLFLKEYLLLKQSQKKDALELKSGRLVGKVCGRLTETGTAQAENILEEFFRHELIALENLPPGLRKKILVEKQTDQFLSDPTQFFRQLDQAQEEEQFREISQSFMEMIPELIKRDRYGEVKNIFSALKKYTQWTRLAGEILGALSQGPVPVLLREKFLAGKKEIRMAIVPLFIALEGTAIPHLLDILKSSEDQWVRKNACEVLIQIGTAATVHLLKALEGQIASVEITGDILRMLGEIKSPEWRTPLMKVLRGYISHEHTKLREQAIRSLCLIGGKEGEEAFLSSLEDAQIEVRKMAIWCLGMIRSQRGLEKMVGLLRGIETSPSLQMDQIETQIYHAFGTLGNMGVAGETPEEILLGVLEKRGVKKWGGFFQKNPLGDSALGAICDALGKMGTQKSVKILGQLKKSLDGSWIPRVDEVLRKIEERAA